jgi:DNA-directed RNA polymerase II subunit RPB11
MHLTDSSSSSFLMALKSTLHSKIRLTAVKDTKIPNMAEFIVQKEDHTLGNLLRMEMLKQPHVLFSGYRMPHPLEHFFVLKIQTTKSSTPLEALKNGINSLITDTLSLESQFKAEVQRISARKPR